MTWHRVSYILYDTVFERANTIPTGRADQGLVRYLRLGAKHCHKAHSHTHGSVYQRSSMTVMVGSSVASCPSQASINAAP
ncbi:uncharacterized protein UV8b_03844 [Ustilaginoidea virens]|uniref:Uncharacterized protein n=1 Tax=Ustilaginoidea virens TaxID=1159556 RepID=A0A8E5HQJ0_USTVR|nr:uncharacterized protein UV8b_03844 [Ustilaginoidea virens]QUC19603.1 hypothetical protein UV8b_03844 [Ustilaginoidea virens]